MSSKSTPPAEKKNDRLTKQELEAIKTYLAQKPQYSTSATTSTETSSVTLSPFDQKLRETVQQSFLARQAKSALTVDKATQ